MKTKEERIKSLAANLGNTPESVTSATSAIDFIDKVVKGAVDRLLAHENPTRPLRKKRKNIVLKPEKKVYYG